MTGIYRVILTIATFVMISTGGMATDGYFSHGIGTHYKMMGGVGISVPRSSLGVAINPAGISFLETRYDLAIALFNPNRQYTVTGNSSLIGYGLYPGTYKSDKPVFFIPSLGANWKLGKKSALGVAIYGNGGMNTEYPEIDGTGVYGGTVPTGISLNQMFINATYAFGLSENHAIGTSLVVGYQWFKAYGLDSFGNISSDPENLSNNDNDNSLGIGFRLGYMGQIGPLHLGAYYQSKLSMGKFGKYKGLYEGQGSFDVPSSFGIGVGVDIGGRLTLLLDYKRIMYTDVPAVANPYVNPILPDFTLNPDFIFLGDNGAMGFGWRDMNVFKFGAEIDLSKQFILRAGYSYGKQPIPDSELLLNILAPAVTENHITAGFTRIFGNDNELNFSFMYAPTSSVTGPNAFDPVAQTIKLEMSQLEFEIGFAF
jgi:long-chain fatty acid transport protein